MASGERSSVGGKSFHMALTHDVKDAGIARVPPAHRRPDERQGRSPDMAGSIVRVLSGICIGSRTSYLGLAAARSQIAVTPRFALWRIRSSRRDTTAAIAAGPIGRG